jgi:hypothetical protein
METGSYDHRSALADREVCVGAWSVDAGKGSATYTDSHSEAIEHATYSLASIQQPSIATAPTTPGACPDDQLQVKTPGSRTTHTCIKLSKQTTELLRGGSCTAFGATKSKEKTILYSSAFEAKKSNTFDGYQGLTIQTRAGHRRIEKQKAIGSLERQLMESCRLLSFLVLLLRTGT